jgi:hypothetical protein
MPGFIKPPFFQSSPAASRGLGVSPVTGCIPGAVHFDGNTAITIAALIADAGDTKTAFSFWAKTVRAPNTVFEYFISNPDTTGHTLPNLWAYQVSGISAHHAHGTPCEAGQQWNPLNQLNVLGQFWPEDEPFNPDNLGGNDAQWMHFLVQLNSSGNRPGAALVNGLNYSLNINDTLGADSTNGLSGLPFFIGGSGMDTNTDGNYLVGDMAEFWLASGVDMLDPITGEFPAATVAKFIGPGNEPVYLGEHGELPTGAIPTIYNHICSGDDPADFLINRGTGGGPFTFARGGPLTLAAVPPGLEPKPAGIFAIVGNTVVGSVLSIPEAFTNAPGVFDYEWWSWNLGTIVATGATYTTVNADVGDQFWAIKVGANGAGSTFMDTAIGLSDPNVSPILFGPITDLPDDVDIITEALNQSIVTEAGVHIVTESPTPPIPLGVTAAGLEPVWAYKETAGLKLPTTKTLPADAALLPPGASFDLTPGLAYVLFTLDASESLWDFTGLEVVADNCVLTLTNCVLGYPSGGRVGTVTNAATMNLVSCDWNATGLLSFFHGTTNIPVGCVMNWNDVHAWGAPRIYADNFGELNTTDCYFEAFGVNTDPGDHGENVKTNVGIRTITRCVMDATEGGPILSGITGMEFWNAQVGNVDVAVADSIMCFPASLGIPYGIQAGVTVPFLTNMTIGGSALQNGTSDYITSNPGCTLIDPGGNFDFDTGLPIDLTRP